MNKENKANMNIENIIEDYGQSIYRISRCYTDSAEEKKSLSKKLSWQFGKV